MDLLEAPVLALLQLEPLLQSWKNICRLFHILAQFPFTISEQKLDYYHQKVNIPVAERFKTQDHEKLRNFKGFPEMLGIVEQVHSCATKL